MSDLLDLALAMQKQQNQAINPQNIKNIIKAIFKTKIFPCRNTVDNGTSIIFFLDASKNTYQRSSIWTFDLSSLNFTISITFFNYNNDDLLRAYTERMKIQSSILIRLINLSILPSFYYFIDRQSGTLKFNYSCSWEQFIRLSIKMQMIIKLVNRIFMNLRLYHQITVFMQPQCLENITFSQQTDPHIVVNQFRIFLQKTINYNNIIRGFVGDILKMKLMNDQKVLQNLPVAENLFLSNVIAYQQSMMGLQKLKQSLDDQRIFEAQQTQIRKHSMGITTNQKSNSINEKIVFGLYQIKQTTPKDESKKQQQWVKLPQEVGAHSIITKKFFKYIMVETIYKNNNSQNKDFKYPEQRNYLICKDCKGEKSKDSFKNQLKAIQYMKDKRSSFIARYYLKLREKWDQSDTIFMKCYQKNLFTFIKQKIRDKMDCLTIRKKLDISYKIAKGLCFLYSNKMIHRDLKPQNIVLDSKLVPKIIDFGSCASHHDSKHFKPYNELLLTTELWNNGLFSNQFSKEKNILLRSKFVKTEHYNQHPLFDVFAFGKILCFIFFYDIKTPNPQLFLNDPHYQVLSHIIFLIQLCTNPDPDDRPGLGQLTAFLGSLRKLLQFSFAQGQSQQQANDKD